MGVVVSASGCAFSACSFLTKATFLLECGQLLHPKTLDEGTLL